MAFLLKRFWWDKLTFARKSHCQHRVMCKKAKPGRRGEVLFNPWELFQYPWEIIGIDYVINPPKK
jgi:hypothetical protein